MPPQAKFHGLRLITFDCANTLLESRWDPSAWAVKWAEEAGIALHREQASLAYSRLLHARWAHFRELNLMRSPEVCDQFWRQLTKDWLREIGASQDFAEPLISLAQRDIYSPKGGVFLEYSDVRLCLERLRADGYKLAVISNWDVSLHRVLDSFGLSTQFDLVVASLEEGIEKPDPRLFEIALKRTGVAAGEALHIGDDPIDDLHGARSAGMSALLLDRSRKTSEPPTLNSLDGLQEVLKWSD